MVKVWMKWLVVMMMLVGGWWWQQKPDGKVHVIFCDVGQGDGMVVVKDQIQVVIDGGPDGSKILKCLANNIPFWDRKIEMIVNTHPQMDHLGGLDEIVARYEVGTLVINNISVELADFERIRRQVMKRSIVVHAPRQGEVIRLGELEWRVIWPKERRGSELVWKEESERVKVLGTYDSDLNELSIVMSLKYGQFDALFTGDISEKEEVAMVESGLITKVELLKVAHHGSKFASSRVFLEKAKPVVAVIEVGNKNRFGHPTKEALERFDLVGSRIYRTDKEGEIEVISDGNKYWISK